MALDPIVSLSVAIAESPGSYAFLLGSGVSRDAGVLTGAEVYWQAVGDLYRLEESVADTPDQEALAEWLDTSGRSRLGYSGVLELLAPDAPTRRDYLAKLFDGAEPGATHEQLAALAERGLVRVFVTTNFDRLLEHALQARGVEPVVVTSDADLAVAPRREHSDCYVLKPHGDYLQQTIRNTSQELAALETGVTSELQEVFDRYGLVAIGYSGSDEAIAEALRQRQSRYGVYWIARGELAKPARSLVASASARTIVRPDAGAFLADLDRRLAVFAAQPSGLTPLTVHNETILMLRRGDRVGVIELLRRERRELEERIDQIVARYDGARPSEEIGLACHDELLPAFERRLASLLPLVVHAEELLTDELESLADFHDGFRQRGSYVFWLELPLWCAWWLGVAIGAFAVRTRRLAALRPLFEARIRDRFGTGSLPLVGSIPGEAGHSIGVAVMKRVDDESYFSPPWEALRRDLADLLLLGERYPELVARDDEPLRSLQVFDFIQNIALRVRDDMAVSHWTMYGASAAEDFARRLHADARLREQVAQAVGLSLSDFDAQAPVALREAHALGRFPDRDAVAILESGSRR